MSKPSPTTSVPATATAERLTIEYGQSRVLDPMDFKLFPGVTALLGRNGAGKTTLMHTLCGIIPPLDGICTVLGAPVADGSAVHSRIGYLGHNHALETRLTVAQNLDFWNQVDLTFPAAGR